MSDDANDVSKALAAFGAPSIRYHSFGQSQVKASSVVLPRRIVPMIPEGFMSRQEETMAPEPAPMMLATPVPPVEIRPAPMLRATEPPPPPTVAPPPRPLAEWAAPAVPPAGIAAPRPAMPPAPFRSMTPATAYVPPPSIVPPSFPVPAQLPGPAVVAAPLPVTRPDMPAPPPIAALRVTSAPHGQGVEDVSLLKKGPSSATRRNLEEIFELLAGAGGDNSITAP